MAKKKQDDFNVFNWSYTENRLSFGWILLLIGVFLLARDVGWLSTDVSIWPVILIILGIYWIGKKTKYI